MARSRSRSRRQRNRRTHEEQHGQSQPFFVKAPPQGNGQKTESAFFQAKLTVNQADDKYEQEADAVANSVVNKTSNTPILQQKRISSIQRLATPGEKKEEELTNDARMLSDKTLQEKSDVQRVCDECGKEEEKKVQKKGSPGEMEEEDIQTKAETTPSASPASISNRVENARSGGRPMPSRVMGEMGSSFGIDLSQVRIHNDAESASMNHELRAQAFTHGKDIYFNTGKFNPETSAGKQLLAHELTHVVQQSSHIRKKTIQRTIGDTHDLSSPRFKGNVELEACFDGEQVIRFGAKGKHVRLIQQALIDAGFPLPRFGVDGVFKSETKAAVKAFQKQSGLEAAQQDGEVGPNTMSRLDSRFTGGSAGSVEQTCENGVKTIKIDFVKMKGASGNATSDIAFANSVFDDCCLRFEIGKQVTMPGFLSDFLLGGDTDFNVGNCGTVSAEDLITFLTGSTLFGLSNPLVVFYVDILHEGTQRLQGVSVSGLCATGLRSPMEGMISVADGADNRTFPHEIAHVLMNTFADHRVTADNLQHISSGGTDVKIAPVQCAIMYTRAG